MIWYGVVPRTTADQRALRVYALARMGMISKADFVKACREMSWEGKQAILWLCRAKAEVVQVQFGGGTGEAPVVGNGPHAHRPVQSVSGTM